MRWLAAVEQEKEGSGGVVYEGNEEGRGESVGFGVGITIDIETPEADRDDSEERQALLLELLKPGGPEVIDGGEGDAEKQAVEAGVGVEVDRMAVQAEYGAQGFDANGKRDAGGDEGGGAPVASSPKSEDCRER